MGQRDNFDTKFSIFAALFGIGILVLLVIGTNSCSASDWNDGICPECGKEVERY